MLTHEKTQNFASNPTELTELKSSSSPISPLSQPEKKIPQNDCNIPQKSIFCRFFHEILNEKRNIQKYFLDEKVSKNLRLTLIH